MSNKIFYPLAGALILASLAFWAFMFITPSSMQASEEIDFNGEVELTMYHSPGCQCCMKWADYLENHGINVTVEQAGNLYDLKQEKGVPNQLSSCHTAIVDGYIVEGHVPVEDIKRLLEERPDAIGLSVPGMPQNSPGMDMPSDQEYQTVLFDEESVTVYNTHN